MKTCFLCGQTDVQMSLEHSIPQFLGGKKSDDKFKKLNLCKSCNSKLGTHVDARFARSFINSIELTDFNNDIFPGRFASIEFKDNDEILNLISENNYVEMMSNDKAVAFWVKENTSDFLGLVGGHPPLSKSKNSQLFLFITKEGINEFELKQLLCGIRNKFKKYKKLDILLCLDFSNNQSMTESELNLFRSKIKEEFHVDGLRFYWEFTEKELKIKDRLRPGGKNFRTSMVFDSNDDIRFLSKLFLGILCGYLGNDFTKSPVGEQLIDILKTYLSREVLSEEVINRFKHPFEIKSSNLYLLEEDAITISIFQIMDDIVGLLGIRKNVYGFKICEYQELSKEEKNILNINSDFCKIPEGKTLVLKPNADRYMEYDVKDIFLEKFFKSKYPSIPEEQRLKIINLL
ncbi:HNH endonuclease [Haemophilus haemolyticus]|uniref:HNH endonuclease n=1 Tax=Haemophilus haemolyticus TaxID=726 RepID=UPI000E5708EB|nr:HNH endonuclease [Haemophilus haemolyticus]